MWIQHERHIAIAKVALAGCPCEATARIQTGNALGTNDTDGGHQARDHHLNFHKGRHNLTSVSAPEGSSIAVGIDTAVPANHHVVVRRPHAGRKGEVVDKFVAAPSLAGMDALPNQWRKGPTTRSLFPERTLACTNLLGSEQ